jgi:hypothetical protein
MQLVPLQRGGVRPGALGDVQGGRHEVGGEDHRKIQDRAGGPLAADGDRRAVPREPGELRGGAVQAGIQFTLSLKGAWSQPLHLKCDSWCPEM